MLLGVWGIGNIMIIFLAALLDVPRQLYEAAALDGAKGAADALRHAARRSARCSCSPPYRGDRRAAVLHPGLRGGPTSAGGGGSAARLGNRLGYPEGSTLFYPRAALPAGLPLFKLGYASAMAVVLLVVAFAVTALIIRISAAGCTTGGGRR